MSASTPPVTPAQIITKRQDIARAASPADVIQAFLDSPQLATILTQAMGPLMRKWGNSAFVGTIGPIIILIAAQLGLTMNENVSKVLSIVLFAAGSSAWQAFSIWRGKKAALAAQARVTGIPTPAQPAAPKGAV